MDQVPAAAVEDVPNPFNKHSSQKNKIESDPFFSYYSITFAIVHCVHLRIHIFVYFIEREREM